MATKVNKPEGRSVPGTPPQLDNSGSQSISRSLPITKAQVNDDGFEVMNVCNHKDCPEHVCIKTGSPDKAGSGAGTRAAANDKTSKKPDKVTANEDPNEDDVVIENYGDAMYTSARSFFGLGDEEDDKSKDTDDYDISYEFTSVPTSPTPMQGERLPFTSDENYLSADDEETERPTDAITKLLPPIESNRVESFIPADTTHFLTVGNDTKLTPQTLNEDTIVASNVSKVNASPNNIGYSNSGDIDITHDGMALSVVTSAMPPSVITTTSDGTHPFESSESSAKVSMSNVDSTHSDSTVFTTSVFTTSSTSTTYKGSDSNDASKHTKAYVSSAPSSVSKRSSTDTVEFNTTNRSVLQRLNARLATYIEKVRYLEAFNKTLETEIGKLRSGKIANGDKLRELYMDQLNSNQAQQDDLQGKLSAAEALIENLRDQLNEAGSVTEESSSSIDEMREKTAQLNNEIDEKKTEVSRLTERCAIYESEVTSSHGTIRQLETDIDTARGDLESASMQHLSAERQVNDLGLQLKFLNSTYQQEIADLKVLLDEAQNHTGLKQYWEGELGKAVREIQAEYDKRLDGITRDMHDQLRQQMQKMKEVSLRGDSSASYLQDILSRQQEKCAALSARITELQSENARVTALAAAYEARINAVGLEKDEQIAMMKEEMLRFQSDQETLLYELQMLTNAKLSMQMEIATYKKLLESELSRMVDNHRERSEDDKDNIYGDINLEDLVNTGVGSGLNVGGGQRAVRAAFVDVNNDDDDDETTDEDANEEDGDDAGDEGLGDEERTRRRETRRLVRIERRAARGGKKRMPKIAITESPEDGKYVTITNNHKRRAYSLEGYTLVKSFLVGDMCIYLFGEVTIVPKQTITIVGQDNQEITHDYVGDFPSWGTGNSDTFLYNPDKEMVTKYQEHDQVIQVVT